MFQRIFKGIRLGGMVAVAAILMSACATRTAPVDPRTPQERQAALDAATAELVGTYAVLDTRSEFFNGRNLKAKELVVRQVNNSLVFTLKGERDKPLQMIAERCNSRAMEDSIYVFCAYTDTEMSSISFSKELKAKEIKTGAMIQLKGPMQVNPGDYVLDFLEHGPGRIHMYVLKKQ